MIANQNKLTQTYHHHHHHHHLLIMINSSVLIQSTPKINGSIRRAQGESESGSGYE